MRSFGGLLIILGIVLVLAAFNLDTGVSSYGLGEVNNIGLLQRQMMVLQTGLAAFISGSVLIAASPMSNVSSESLMAHSALRSGETEEEHEERLAGVRRLNRNIGISVAALLALLILVAVIHSEIG